MLKYRKELLEFVKKFIKICNQENIWYSLDASTLKGAIKHSGFIPWEEHFDVMITLNDYKKLKRLYPQHIIDSSIDRRHKKLSVSFVENITNWLKPQPFVSMRVLIPSTTKKIKKFSSIIFRIKNIFYLRFDNIKHAIDDLYDKDNYEGFYLLEKRKKFDSKNWIQTISMITQEKNFSGIKVNVIKEYDQILKYWYGNNYLKKDLVPSIWYKHISPSLKERKKE